MKKIGKVNCLIDSLFGGAKLIYALLIGGGTVDVKSYKGANIALHVLEGLGLLCEVDGLESEESEFDLGAQIASGVLPLAGAGIHFYLADKTA